MHFKDQLGNTVQLRERPLRIISVVPSQSEFLWDIGIRKELVGITKFCIHPYEMFTNKERVGGTKNLDLEKIRKLQPDLIIGNKEENDKVQIEELQKEFPVWMSDIYTFEDAFEMMESLGSMLNKKKEAEKFVRTLKNSLPDIKSVFQSKRTAYFIWNKPYMFAGKNTFIDHVLHYLGLESAMTEYDRYPELDEATLQKINPEWCFLSSEPFPFKETHVAEIQKILPRAKIVVVDGEMFSWYGTRLLHLEKYVRTLLQELEKQD